MKTIIVTGGAGFIGSHLCDFLLDKNEKVISVDNFLTGSKKNVEHLLDEKNFELIEHNIVEPLSIREKIDQIYNLASPASPIDYQEKPIETILANSAGVKNMLDLAKEKKAAFLQASTSEVYGDPLQHPQKEDYWGNVNPIGPRSCYDESKRFAEAITMAYNRKFKLDARIVRIFNTYGPRMRKDDGRVIPNFINQALSAKPLTVYGDGKQTRSFCFVSNLVEGLYLTMNSKCSTPINLGNPNEISIIELAEKIISLTRSSSKIVFNSLPLDDPTRRKPDITKAKKILRWEPKTDFEEGLKETIKYFSKTLAERK